MKLPGGWPIPAGLRAAVQLLLMAAHLWGKAAPWSAVLSCAAAGPSEFHVLLPHLGSVLAGLLMHLMDACCRLRQFLDVLPHSSAPSWLSAAPPGALALALRGMMLPLPEIVAGANCATTAGQDRDTGDRGMRERR